MNGRSYLDHNATSPVRPEVRAAVIDALDYFGNPSSIHAEGRAARALIEDARETAAQIFGVKPSAVTFTSGGTEAANWLLQPRNAGKFALSAVEHPCVFQGHRSGKADVSILPVSGDGVIDLDALDETLSPASFVAVQAANNETGVIQPLEEIARIVHSRDATLICDAVQAVGRLDVSGLRSADAIFVSAHKFGGPKGVGAVVSRGDAEFPALIYGGGQERRQRSGTENVAGIAGLGTALQLAVEEQASFAARTLAFRAKLEAGLELIAPDAVIFGNGADRLPNTTCFAVPGKRAEMLLMAFDLEGIALSSGSACSSGKVERSHVLEAMRVAPDMSEGAMRVSTGWDTQENDIERFLAVLSKICNDRQARRAA